MIPAENPPTLWSNAIRTVPRFTFLSFPINLVRIAGDSHAGSMALRSTALADDWCVSGVLET
jgi:hypothetical protein